MSAPSNRAIQRQQSDYHKRNIKTLLYTHVSTFPEKKTKSRHQGDDCQWCLEDADVFDTVLAVALDKNTTW